MKEPYREADLKRVCDAAFGRGSVVVSKHAKERMAECNLNINDVRNILKGGKLINFEPGYGGMFKYRVTTYTMDVAVIATGPASILLVTAFRRDK